MMRNNVTAHFRNCVYACKIDHMKIITVANLKGGAGKTTSVALLAHAYVSMGKRVLCVDADPQGSLLEWSDEAEWDVGVIGMPTKTIHKTLKGMRTDGYDVIIIDTPPLEEEAGIVHSAMRAADQLVITLAPTMMELRRVRPTLDAIETVNSVRVEELDVHVLLNRTVANAASTGAMRKSFEEIGLSVLRAEIPRREAIGQAFGLPITRLHHYDTAAEELG